MFSHQASPPRSVIRPPTVSAQQGTCVDCLPSRHAFTPDSMVRETYFRCRSENALPAFTFSVLRVPVRVNLPLHTSSWSLCETCFRVQNPSPVAGSIRIVVFVERFSVSVNHFSVEMKTLLPVLYDDVVAPYSSVGLTCRSMASYFAPGRSAVKTP